MRNPETRYVELAEGRRMRVRRWPGRGTPLVMLHGLLDSSEGWDPLARATHRPAIAIDLPGFGHSDRAGWPRVGAFARMVVEALERLEVDDCALVGHSLGGAVASSVAERAPERISSLLLMAPAGYGRIGLAELLGLPVVRDVAMHALPHVLRSPRAVRVAYSRAIANGLSAPGALMQSLNERAERVGPGTRDAVIAIAAAGRSPRAFHRRTLEYQGPVTALWGSDDQLVPVAHADSLARAIPHSRLVIWDRTGHHPQVEAPGRLSRLVEWTATQGRDRRRHPRPFPARRRHAAPARLVPLPRLTG